MSPKQRERTRAITADIRVSIQTKTTVAQRMKELQMWRVSREFRLLADGRRQRTLTVQRSTPTGVKRKVKPNNRQVYLIVLCIEGAQVFF